MMRSGIRQWAVALVFTFAAAGLSSCSTDDHGGDEGEVRDVSVEARHIVGWRFICHDDLHYPKGTWRGEFNHYILGARTEGRLHRKRWGCDFDQTEIRPEY